MKFFFLSFLKVWCVSATWRESVGTFPYAIYLKSQSRSKSKNKKKKNVYFPPENSIENAREVNFSNSEVRKHKEAWFPVLSRWADAQVEPPLILGFFTSAQSNYFFFFIFSPLTMQFPSPPPFPLFPFFS